MKAYRFYFETASNFIDCYIFKDKESAIKTHKEMEMNSTILKVGFIKEIDYEDEWDEY